VNIELKTRERQNQALIAEVGELQERVTFFQVRAERSEEMDELKALLEISNGKLAEAEALAERRNFQVVEEKRDAADRLTSQLRLGESLREEISRLSLHNHKSEQEISRLTQESQKSVGEISRLTSENQKIAGDLSEVNRDAKDLKEEISRLVSEKDNLNRKCNAQREEISSSSETIASLIKAKGAGEEQISRLNQSSSDLTEEISRVSENLRASDECTRTLTAKVLELEGRVTYFQVRAERAQDIEGLLEITDRRLAEAEGAAETRNFQVAVDKREAEERLASQVRLAEISKEEISRLNREKIQSEEKISRLNRENLQSEEEISRLNEEISRLSGLISEFSRGIELSGEEISRSNREAAVFNAEISRLKAEISGLNQDRQLSQVEISRLNEEISRSTSTFSARVFSSELLEVIASGERERISRDAEFQQRIDLAEIGASAELRAVKEELENLRSSAALAREDFLSEISSLQGVLENEKCLLAISQTEKENAVAENLSLRELLENARKENLEISSRRSRDLEALDKSQADRLRFLEERHRVETEKLAAVIKRQDEDMEIVILQAEKSKFEILEKTQAEIAALKRQFSAEISFWKSKVEETENNLAETVSEQRRILADSLAALKAKFEEEISSINRSREAAEAVSRAQFLDLEISTAAELASAREAFDLEKETILAESAANQARLAEKAISEKFRLQTEIGNWQEKFAARPARSEDLQEIKTLNFQVSEQKTQLEKMSGQLQNLKMELMNREENYNRVFNAAPKVGIFNPLKK